jgi:hypothetical protein
MYETSYRPLGVEKMQHKSKTFVAPILRAKYGTFYKTKSGLKSCVNSVKMYSTSGHLKMFKPRLARMHSFCIPFHKLFK